jgi:hypothetical protein
MTKVHAFVIPVAIQDIVVMASGMKPAITPTYYYPALFIVHWDIVFISQVQNSDTCVTFRNCIFGMRNPHFG